MKYINKYTVGMIVITLAILGYTVDILPDRIVVDLPSDECGTALLRVTKDDFTLKCGSRIAFQADTIVEYYKTYGPDEWVRNFRYVGRAKKSITLELFEYKDSFDIIRTTRYRKGRQYLEDGILEETYTFTKDKVKISYNYQVNNKAKHRISMRIKKQYNSFLDASDPNGNVGFQKNNLLYYEGYGDLLIDPTVTLDSPANATTSFNEGDTVSFVCNTSQSNESRLVNVSLYWNALNESDWVLNETATISSNVSTTFTKTIPHPITDTFPGTFRWNCLACNDSGTPGNCSFQATNWTLDPRYIPNPLNITSPNNIHINLLNGSATGWNMLETHYIGLGNATITSPNQTIWVNWTHPGLRDNGTGIVWNLSYFGTLDSTRKYIDFHNYVPTKNTTILAEWNVSNLDSDAYFLTLIACNALNTTLCTNTTITYAVDIFDYAVNITTGEPSIRFSPQPTYNDKRAALGQTATEGIIKVDWLGSNFPDGKVNLSLNLTNQDDCMTIYALDSNTPSSARTLSNLTYTTGINASASDPDYIWLWATKANCGTTTKTFSFDIDFFFGGNFTGG